MKKIIAVCLLLLAFIPASATRSLDRVRDFGENPGKLTMFHYLPANMDSTEEYPLVLILHGSMLSARSMKRCGGWNKLADSLGVLLLYPQQRFTNNIARAFSVHFNNDMKKLNKEILSVRNMIMHMRKTYPVDHENIYITGLSAGGSMSHVMLHAYPQLFGAAALIAAPSAMPLKNDQFSGPLPRLAVIQGKRDKIVTPENASGIMEQWRKAYGFDINATDTVENYRGNPHLTAYSYKKGNETRLIRLDAAKTGHQMLIDPGKSVDKGGKRSVYSKDIDFHLPWWIMDFFGLTDRKPER